MWNLGGGVLCGQRVVVGYNEDGVGYGSGCLGGVRVGEGLRIGEWGGAEETYGWSINGKGLGGSERDRGVVSRPVRFDG